MCFVQRDLPFPRQIRPVYRHNSQETYTMDTALCELGRIVQFLNENRTTHDEQCRTWCVCAPCELVADLQKAIAKYRNDPIVLPAGWESGDHADEICPAEEYCPIRRVDPHAPMRIHIVHMRQALLDIQKHDRRQHWTADGARGHLLAGNIVWLDGYQWRLDGERGCVSAPSE